VMGDNVMGDNRFQAYTTHHLSPITYRPSPITHVFWAFPFGSGYAL
jgi:hypothetical protein